MIEECPAPSKTTMSPCCGKLFYNTWCSTHHHSRIISIVLDDILFQVACQRLQHINFVVFAHRCNTEVEFRLILCCLTCNRHRGSVEYDRIAESLVVNTVLIDAERSSTKGWSFRFYCRYFKICRCLLNWLQRWKGFIYSVSLLFKLIFGYCCLNVFEKSDCPCCLNVFEASSCPCCLNVC